MGHGVVDRVARGFNDCAPFVIVSPGKSMRQVVGVVLLRDDGAALLQHRDDISTISDPGLWVFPGGHLESGETPQDGAVREVEEETCLSLSQPAPVNALSGRGGGALVLLGKLRCPPAGRVPGGTKPRFC